MTDQKVIAILPKYFAEGMVDQLAQDKFPELSLACPSDLLPSINGHVKPELLKEVADEETAARLCDGNEVAMCLTNMTAVRRHSLWVVKCLGNDNE